MIARGAAVAIGAALAIACGAVEPSPLVSTHTSASALAEAVLRGFERRDVQALRALSLTEAEFQDHIWPELPASRPERNLPFSYVWGDLRQKSESSLAESIARYGGRALVLLRVEYAGETTRYPSFNVHRDTVLVVRGSDAVERQVRLYGSTVEKDGLFKVFSYVVDD
jgi:hypothetical protein